MSLDFYNNEIAAKKKIIDQVIATVGNSTNAENILLAIKAIESLENVDLYPEFKIAVETIVAKILSLDLFSVIFGQACLDRPSSLWLDMWKHNGFLLQLKSPNIS